MDTIQQVVSETFSREADRILAALIGTVRDFELAEDALQDALLVALERWSIDGIPHNPSAWIDRKSTRLNSSHIQKSRMPSSAWIGRASCRERV